MSHSIAIGNWTPYVQSEINGKESASFIIGKSGGGTVDPAKDCKKRFTATYQCGTGPNKQVNIDPDAWGQAALFDCTAESKNCAGFKLTLGDDGNLVLTNANNSQIWSSNTNKTGLALPEYSAKNGKNGRNYLLAGEVLNVGEFMGSPSGNCYLMMMKETGLQVLYSMSACADESASASSSASASGSANASASSSTAFPMYSLPQVNSSNIGKVGYINNMGKLQEYPSELIGQDSTYTLIGNYDSVGNDIKQMSGTVDECKKTCNDLIDCYGFVYKSTKKSSGGIQFVKVHFPPNQAQCIQISQLAVYSNGVNVAQNKPVSSANVYSDSLGSCPPQNAVDGDLSQRQYPNIYHSSCKTGDYWLVDLQQEYPVDKVVYYNRSDSFSDRANGMMIDLMDSTKKVIKTLTLNGDMIQSFDVSIGLTTTMNNTCLLKNAGMFPKGLRQPNEDYELYTRNKNVKNNSSCNKTVENSTLTQWELFPMGEKMTMDTLCNLGAITAQERKDLETKRSTLSDVASLLSNKLVGLTNEKTKIEKTIELNNAKITTDINSYKKTKHHMVMNNINNVDGMIQDTKLNMISQNYKKIIWSILVILVIIGAIRYAQS